MTLKLEPELFSMHQSVPEVQLTKSKVGQQCRAFEALKTRRILPKFGRLDNVPTVASMDVATREDIPFLVRRVVREELVRLQAGDVHHQCSFAACPEPPPYWMRERHVENQPRTETADFTPWLPFSPTGRGHHRMSSSRRAAADLRPSSTRPLPEDYYASSQNVPAEHDPSPRTSATSAPANVSRHVPVCYTCGLLGHISCFCPRRPPAPPRFSTYPARMYETPVPPRFLTHRLVCTKLRPFTRPTTVPDSNGLTNFAASLPSPSEA
ncbi:hypothetical protein HPB51_013239 [Rhipicephalus microplus]|uniref:CCHC-type domain-containing protein n=1 Tax=Rhipicephalus microplus TaxID=6941 RepID=A0A9J6F430_RHIMP|nr:hypothetical protein HPB51_013239 [Rhipicephalus microplus]